MGGHIAPRSTGSDSNLGSTLIDSTPGVIHAWDTFGKQYGFDGAEAVEGKHALHYISYLPELLSLAKATHGVRLVDSLTKWCSISDPAILKVNPLNFRLLLSN